MTNAMERVGPRPGRRSLLGLLLASAVWGGGLAVGKAQGQAGGQADARQAVSELYAGLEAEMRAGGSFQQRFALLAPVIDRVFDLSTILQTSVGLRWSSLDEASRQKLFTVFRAFTVASYTANFDKPGDETFEVLPRTRPSGQDVIAESRLIPKDGDPVRLDYVMRSGDMGWRIIDVLLDGTISRVAVQRSDFRSLLASGDPTPLINSLKRKVSDLSGGTMRVAS
jgi:phospholipid transport system substrate-binding protein